MKHIIVLFIISFLSVSNGASYIKTQNLSQDDLVTFKTAFKKSWRSLSLDKYLNESDEVTKASGYSDDLPVWTLTGACDNKKLYYFDLAQYFVKGTDSEPHNFGEGYTGSSGTRRLILSLDEATQKLSIVFDANIIDLVGTTSTETCADIFVTMSGAHFLSKTNGEYGIARLVYDSKLKKYKSLKNREKLN